SFFIVFYPFFICLFFIVFYSANPRWRLHPVISVTNFSRLTTLTYKQAYAFLRPDKPPAPAHTSGENYETLSARRKGYVKDFVKRTHVRNEYNRACVLVQGGRGLEFVYQACDLERYFGRCVNGWAPADDPDQLQHFDFFHEQEVAYDELEEFGLAQAQR